MLWPIPPTQVAHYAAVTLGLVALLWLSGRVSGRVALAVVAPTLAMLLLTHTRTALFAMVIGLVVGGLSLFAARSRVRKAFLTVALVVTVGGLTLAGVVTHWLARGETGQELTALTGRTTVWQLVLTYPRNWFEVLFGFGLSNNSFHGLPIDSNWLATYHDQGLAGLALCAAMVLFLLVTAYFQPAWRAPRAGAVPGHLLPDRLVHRDRAQPALGLPAGADPGRLPAGGAAGGAAPAPLSRPQRGQPVRPTTLRVESRPPAGGKAALMKILQAHNRYRSAAPSGENRVVDTEAEALAALGHEVIRFERRSDDIEGWSRAQQASLPARAVWNPETRRDLRSVLRATRPDVVHLHNTFPLLSPAVLYACREARVPVVATLHNYKLACANGEFYRQGAVCHDCADGRPGQAIQHGCYRGSRVASVPVVLTGRVHRPAWRSLVSAYIFISASQRDLLSGVGLPPDRVFVRHNLIPSRDVTSTPPTTKTSAASPTLQPRQPHRARGPRPWSTPGGSIRPREPGC